MNDNKFVPGQRVICNGNKEARIIGYYSEGMVSVRLWQGFRHVGDVCVCAESLKRENEVKP